MLHNCIFPECQRCCCCWWVNYVPGISGQYFTIGYCVPKMVSRNCCYTLSPLFCVWPFVSSFTALLLNNLSKLQIITIANKHITCKSLRKEKQRYSLRTRVSRFSAVFLQCQRPYSLAWRLQLSKNHYIPIPDRWSKGFVGSKCACFHCEQFLFVASSRDLPGYI